MLAEVLLRDLGCQYSPAHIDVRRESDWREEHANRSIYASAALTRAGVNGS